MNRSLTLTDMAYHLFMTGYLASFIYSTSKYLYTPIEDDDIDLEGDVAVLKQVPKNSDQVIKQIGQQMAENGEKAQKEMQQLADSVVGNLEEAKQSVVQNTSNVADYAASFVQKAKDTAVKVQNSKQRMPDVSMFPEQSKETVYTITEKIADGAANLLDEVPKIKVSDALLAATQIVEEVSKQENESAQVAKEAKLASAPIDALVVTLNNVDFLKEVRKYVRVMKKTVRQLPTSVDNGFTMTYNGIKHTLSGAVKVVKKVGKAVVKTRKDMSKRGSSFFEEVGHAKTVIKTEATNYAQVSSQKTKGFASAVAIQIIDTAENAFDKAAEIAISNSKTIAEIVWKNSKEVAANATERASVVAKQVHEATTDNFKKTVPHVELLVKEAEVVILQNVGTFAEEAQQIGSDLSAEIPGHMPFVGRLNQIHEVANAVIKNVAQNADTFTKETKEIASDIGKNVLGEKATVKPVISMAVLQVDELNKPDATVKSVDSNSNRNWDRIANIGILAQGFEVWANALSLSTSVCTMYTKIANVFIEKVNPLVLNQANRLDNGLTYLFGPGELTSMAGYDLDSWPRFTGLSEWPVSGPKK